MDKQNTIRYRDLTIKQDRPVSYEELKDHSSYSDAWLSINGIVYDITNFIEKHPFGDTFRGHLGSECGGLFSAAHVNTNVESLLKSENFRRKNYIKVIGQLDVADYHLHQDKTMALKFLDRIVYKDTNKDEFWQDLKNGVAAFLKENNETTHYSNEVGILFIIYYLCIYLVLSYLTWVGGSFISAILLGVHLVCMLSNIAHMSTHSGFTRSPLIDFIAMHLFDLIGMSGLEWQITHQTHHYQPHSVIDHQTSSIAWIGIRIHKYMKHRFFHRFQHIYYWVAISLYFPSKLILTTLWLLVYRKFLRHKWDVIIHLMSKLILFSQVIYCMRLHGFWMGLAVFAVYAVTLSQTAFILLFNDHEETHQVLGEAKDAKDFHGKKSWAEVQVRASGNWYPTNWLLAFIEFHYGYFNYHIEHHLFPTLKPILLKKISPVVRKVCMKHGIPYISTPFGRVQTSLQEHINKLSNH